MVKCSMNVLFILVQQLIKYFNNIIDGEYSMEIFTKDELIDLIELISVE